MNLKASAHCSKLGFTLLELLTTLVVIGILSLVAMQAFTFIVAKAERVKCTNNLRNLYAAAASYVSDNGTWPQIPVDDIEDPAYISAWIDALSPYKLSAINWICPSIQKELGNPPYEGAEHARIDYIATPFGEGPNTPYLWPTHPWFLERGNVHGDGNLIIFTNGQIRSMMEVKNDSKTVVLP